MEISTCWSANGDMSLEEYFEGWVDIICFHRKRCGKRGALLLSYMSKIAFPLIVIFDSWSAVGAFHDGNLEDDSLNIRFVFGAYGTLWPVAIFTYQEHQLFQCFTRLQRIASAIEAGVASGSKEHEDLRGAAKSAGAWRFWMYMYSIWVLFSSAVPSFLAKKPATDLYPSPTSDFGQWAAIVMSMLTVCMSATHYFAYFSLVIGTTKGCAAMNRCLGRRLESAEGPGEFTKIARLHGDLSAAWLEFRTLIATSFTHSLSASLTTTCLVTFSLVRVLAFDMFCLAILPLIGIVFIPCCEAGEEMSASSESLGKSAYAGAWVEEDPQTRRVCLLVLLMVRHQGTLYAKPLGEVNRRACFNCLKSWFKYVHALINLKVKH